jgi:WD40 repeat protein
MHAFMDEYTHIHIHTYTHTYTHIQQSVMLPTQLQRIIEDPIRPTACTCTAISHDSSLVASGNLDCIIKVWILDTGALQHIIPSNHGRVYCLDFSRDATLLYSGSNQGTIKVWRIDADSHTEVKSLAGHVGCVLAIKISYDGAKLASASEDGTVVVWSAESGERLCTLTGHVGVVRCVVWSCDSAVLVSAGRDRSVRFWSLDTRAQARDALVGHSATIFSLALGSVSRRVFCADGNKIVVWELKADAPATIAYTLQGHTGHVTSIALSPHEKFLVSGSMDQTVRLWDAKRGQLVRVLAGPSFFVHGVEWTQDGQTVVSASDKLHVWGFDPCMQVRVCVCVCGFAGRLGLFCIPQRYISLHDTVTCKINGNRSDGVPSAMWYTDPLKTIEIFPCIFQVAAGRFVHTPSCSKHACDGLVCVCIRA